MLSGTTLGQYQIQQELGRGGMATVYRAMQISLNRTVAIKVIAPQWANDPSFLARFRQEATVIAGLAHPNILPVYDFGEQQGLFYIVMAYVPGGTLKDRLLRPLEPGAIVRITSQLAAALDYAHRQGIVHRDLKPANVLMGEQDWPLLSDFGIARVLGSNARLTQAGASIGTPQYMSPEQALGQPDVDARTDIYSLGVILYEMLTGRVPFDAPTAIGVMQKQLYEPVPLPSLLRQGLPAAIEQVVLKALAKQPEARYQTAGEFGRALEAAFEATRAPGVRTGDRARSSDRAVAVGPTHELQGGGGRAIEARPDGLGREPFPAARPAVGANRALLLGGGIVLAGLLLAVIAGAWWRNEQEATARRATTATAVAIQQATAEAAARLTATVQAQVGATATVQARAQGTATALGQTATRLFGPVEGQLNHPDTNTIPGRFTTERPQDFIAEVRFHNPYDRSEKGWDYGLFMRNTGGNQNYRLILSPGTGAAGRYRFFLVEGNPNEPRGEQSGAIPNMELSASGSNLVRVVVKGETLLLFVNEQYIATLDSGAKIAPGTVGAGTGFSDDNKIPGRATRYEGFTVWGLS